MRIGELAAATGTKIETIRFYEKSGLLSAPPRRENGYREYGKSHIDQLTIIRDCRVLDIPLPDIKQLLYAFDPTRGNRTDVNRRIEQQLIRVGARLKWLQALETKLQSLKTQRRPASGRRRERSVSRPARKKRKHAQ